MNNQFVSVFTNENSDIPQLPTNHYPVLQDIIFSTFGIKCILEKLDPSKSAGLDGIPIRVLKSCVTEISPILQVIFTQSLNEGRLPNDWLKANITPIHKKGDQSIPANYRPISLTSVCCKVMEHIIFHTCMSHLENNNIINSLQHGFRPGYSCTSQLIKIIEYVAKNMGSLKQVDMIFLDFAKAFDTVPHQRLLKKLQYYGINNNTYHWISNWLTKRTQRVLVNGSASNYVPVTSGVPQGTVLGPLMFPIYINDINKNVISSSIGLFSNDCVIYKATDTKEGCILLQKDLDTLSQWARIWQMHFNINKCILLRFTRSSSPILNEYLINGQPIQCSDTYKYLGIQLNRTLSWKIHITTIINKATRMLNFIKRNLSKCSISIKSTAYMTLVRPILEVRICQ